MTSKNTIAPVQPYLVLNAENYRGIPAGRMGIANFYQFTVHRGAAGEFQAVPDGSTDLVFGIGEKDIKLYLGGTVLKAKQWEFEDGRTYFGVRFLPGKCVLPKNLKIQEVVNADLEIDVNDYGKGLAEQIAQESCLEKQAELFAEYLSQRQKNAQERNTVTSIEKYVRRRIYESNGNVTIKELAREAGYSECYIRRSFELVHGISPKIFERFVRFQNMLGNIEKSPAESGIDCIAMECGYYDQSHMMKDFKSFTGTTPEHYRKMILEKRQKNSCTVL